MVCVPTSNRATSLRLAVPVLSSATFQDWVVLLTVYVKNTDPVGMVAVCPEVVSETVALIEKRCPSFSEDGVGTAVTEVVSPG
jgi:hypothetical protein